MARATPLAFSGKLPYRTKFLIGGNLAILANEIVEDLQAALEQFAEIVEDLA
jgi:hypothetical protein